MNIELGDLPVGKWRYVSPDELQKLEQSLKGQKFYNERAGSD